MTGAHVINVASQELELRDRPEDADQRPVDLSEEPMLGPGRIEAMQTLFFVKNIDVATVDTRL